MAMVPTSILGLRANLGNRQIVENKAIDDLCRAMDAGGPFCAVEMASLIEPLKAYLAAAKLTKQARRQLKVALLELTNYKEPTNASDK